MSYDTRKDPCKKNACMIQKCLKENKFQESACEEVLELMRECCRKYKHKSLCCEGIDIEFSKALLETKAQKKDN